MLLREPIELFTGMKYPPGKIEVKKLCFRAEMIETCTKY